jgi:hypothetical protein
MIPGLRTTERTSVLADEREDFATGRLCGDLLPKCQRPMVSIIPAFPEDDAHRDLRGYRIVSPQKATVAIG